VTTLPTWDRASLLDELRKLRRPIAPHRLDVLVSCRLIPTVSSASGSPVFSPLSLLALLRAAAEASPATSELLRDDAEIYRAALRADRYALAELRARIAAWRAESGQLGDVVSHFARVAPGALDSMRGDARLDWRLWQAEAQLDAHDEQLGRLREPGTGSVSSGSHPSRLLARLDRAVTASQPAIAVQASTGSQSAEQPVLLALAATRVSPPVARPQRLGAAVAQTIRSPRLTGVIVEVKARQRPVVELPSITVSLPEADVQASSVAGSGAWPLVAEEDRHAGPEAEDRATLDAAGDPVSALRVVVMRRAMRPPGAVASTRASADVVEALESIELVVRDGGAPEAVEGLAALALTSFSEAADPASLAAVLDCIDRLPGSAARTLWDRLDRELRRAGWTAARVAGLCRFAERLPVGERAPLLRQAIDLADRELHDPGLAFGIGAAHLPSGAFERGIVDELAYLTTELEDPDVWFDVLERAFASLVLPYRREVGERLAMAYETASRPELALAIHLELRRLATRPADYIADVRAAGRLLCSELDRVDEAIDLFNEAVTSRRYDDEIVGELGRLLVAASRTGDWVSLLRSELEAGADPVRSIAMARRLYLAARDEVADRDLSSRSLDEVLESPRFRPDALLAKVPLPDQRLAAEREVIAIRRRLATSLPPEAAMALRIRVATLRASVLEQPGLAFEELSGLLPRVPDDPALLGAVDLAMRRLSRHDPFVDHAVAWLERRAESVPHPADAFRLCSEVALLKERSGRVPAERVAAAESALSWAERAKAGPQDRAAMHLAVARAKGESGAWNTAAHHAVRAAELVAEQPDDPAVLRLTLDALISASERGLVPAAVLSGVAFAAASEDPGVLERFAQLCSRHEMWAEALQALERLASLLPVSTPPEVRTRVAQALAEVFQRLNS
jgi:tetratricopeptide (TPR) repeat protein